MPVCHELNAVHQPAAEIINQHQSVFSIATANEVADQQLAVGFDCGPAVPGRRIARALTGRRVRRLRVDEAPTFTPLLSGTHVRTMRDLVNAVTIQTETLHGACRGGPLAKVHGARFLAARCGMNASGSVVRRIRAASVKRNGCRCCSSCSRYRLAATVPVAPQGVS